MKGEWSRWRKWASSRGAALAPLLSLCLVGACPALAQRPPASRPPSPPSAPSARVGELARPGQVALDFTLRDSRGKLRRLSDFAGRPVALFFFCGCSWCSDVAAAWSALGQGGKPTRGAAVTVVVYQGSGEEVESSARRSGWDLSGCALLPDEKLVITQQLYNADPCPRVLALDGARVVRYINSGRDDLPREAPAMLLASRCLDALRALARAPRPKRVTPAPGSRP